MDAIVLAGGKATRLDGADKTALVVGGRTLLERVLDAVRDGTDADALTTDAQRISELRGCQRPARLAARRNGRPPGESGRMGFTLGSTVLPWGLSVVGHLPHG